MPRQVYDPAQDQPETGDVHSRYATLGGATVAMLHAEPNPYAPNEPVFTSACGGCRAQCGPYSEDSVRNWANQHAGQCRAMPPGATA